MYQYIYIISYIKYFFYWYLKNDNSEVDRDYQRQKNIDNDIKIAEINFYWTKNL